MNRRLLAFSLLLTACGPSYNSTAELALKGWAMAGTSRQEFDVSGAWTLPDCEDSLATACHAWYASDKLDDPRWLMPAFNAPTTSSGAKLGVELPTLNGLFTGPLGNGYVALHIEGQGDPSTNSTQLNPYQLQGVVDRAFFRDDPNEPWQMDFLLDGQYSTSQGEFTYKGKASARPYCKETKRDRGQLCGGTGQPGEARERLDQTAVVLTPAGMALLPCPSEVHALFLDGTQPLRGDGGAMSLKSGAATPLKCIETTEGGLVCGASAKVTTPDGCSWAADIVLGLIGGVYLTAKSTGCIRDSPYCSDVLHAVN